MYIETHEVNPLIEYVQKNIRDGEYLYASSASYVLRFRNGYNTNKIGAVSHDNILYGGDISHIVDARKVFLIFQRRPSASFLKELETKGYLHEVGSCYQTPLYYFSTDGDDPRLQEVFESRDFNDDITIIFRFTIKRIINIWVKNDDDTDKIYIHADTYKRGVVVPHEFSVRRP
ncbi:hypothetical protein FACS189498_1450 [Spirochaetia bacterium]|nr:hypothetical protein FACS189498_1450 [Spirochaetia bacterium]